METDIQRERRGQKHAEPIAPGELNRVIREVQAFFAHVAPADVVPSDELTQERRSEGKSI